MFYLPFTSSKNDNNNIASILINAKSTSINYGDTYSHTIASINTRRYDFFHISSHITNNGNSNFITILTTEFLVNNNDGTYPSWLALGWYYNIIIKLVLERKQRK